MCMWGVIRIRSGHEGRGPYRKRGSKRSHTLHLRTHREGRKRPFCNLSGLLASSTVRNVPLLLKPQNSGIILVSCNEEKSLNLKNSKENIQNEVQRQKNCFLTQKKETIG